MSFMFFTRGNVTKHEPTSLKLSIFFQYPHAQVKITGGTVLKHDFFVGLGQVQEGFKNRKMLAQCLFKRMPDNLLGDFKQGRHHAVEVENVSLRIDSDNGVFDILKE